MTQPATQSVQEYIIDMDNIYLDDIVDLQKALTAGDFAGVNAVLIRVVTTADNAPVKRIKSKHALALATKIIQSLKASADTDAYLGN